MSSIVENFNKAETRMEISHQSVYMKDIYKEHFEYFRGMATEKIKSVFARFITEMEEFYQSDVHNKYLYDYTKDKQREMVCSNCEKPTAAITPHLAFIFPLLPHPRTLNISRCDDCGVKIQEYINFLHFNFGPFGSAELQKNKICTNEFGNEVIIRDTLKLPNVPKDKWHCEDLHIAYDQQEDSIEVIINLAKRDFRKMGYKSVPFKQVILANPKVDFRKVIQEMPDSPGGNFVKNYIREHLSSDDAMKLTSIKKRDPQLPINLTIRGRNGTSFDMSNTIVKGAFKIKLTNEK